MFIRDGKSRSHFHVLWNCEHLPSMERLGEISNLRGWVFTEAKSVELT